MDEKSRAGIPTAVAAGAIGQLVNRVSERLADQRYRRIEAVLLQAAAYAGTSTEEIVQRLESTGAAWRLLIETLIAARDEHVETKLFAFADALARGASNDKKVAVERLVVAALRDLDQAHIDMLQMIDYIIPSLVDPENKHGAYVEEEHIEAPFTSRFGATSLLPAMVGPLERHGLINRVSIGGWGGGRERVAWEMSWLGTTLLERLHQIGSALAGRVDDQNVGDY